MGNICIIPARGGSKRISNKNIKLFLGIPIISYAIKAAIDSKLFDEVMVSTDTAEIAEISIHYGAKVPFLRTEKNADDFATTYDVIEEVLHKYAENGTHFNAVCCIYPCAPFVNSNVLTRAYHKLIDNHFDIVFPVIKYSFPIQRALKIVEKKAVFFDDKFKTTRSQDLEPSFHDAGQFYWAVSLPLLESKSLLTNNTGVVEISELDGQDIDTLTDWKLAELKYSLIERR